MNETERDLASGSEIFPSVQSTSPVWSKLMPVVQHEGSIALNWQPGRADFFYQFLVHAPLDSAKAIARGMINSQGGGMRRFATLCEACAARSELALELGPQLLAMAETVFERCCLGASLPQFSATPADERAAKQELRNLFEDFLRRIAPGGQPQYPPQIRLEVYAWLPWTEEDTPWLMAVVDKIRSPSTLESAVPYLLDILTTLIANGPRGFAEKTQKPITGWMSTAPQWRKDPHGSRGGPLSVVNVEGRRSSEVEDAFARVAYQLRRKLGPGLDEFIARWIMGTLVRSDFPAGMHLVYISLATAASIRRQSRQRGKAKKTEDLQFFALLEANRIALYSLAARYRENRANVSELFWGLQGLRLALFKPEQEQPDGPNLDSEVVSLVLNWTGGFWQELSTCPDPAIRQQLAGILHGSVAWSPLPQELQRLLDRLRVDARARVRREAHGNV